MPMKAILRFNGSTQAQAPSAYIGYTGSAHSFGFSESIWRDSSDFNVVKNWIKNLVAPMRAGLLPSNVQIVDALIYATGDGQATEVPLGITGVQGLSDQADVALLISTRNSAAYAQRKWWLHCLPDDWVTSGELTLTQVRTAILAGYLSACNAGHWNGLVRNDLNSIVTISQAGLVSLPGPSPFAVGQLLRVTRALTEDKRRVGDELFVSSIGPLANQFTLGAWTLGACTGGQVFRPTYAYFSIGAGEGAFVERAGTREVGRPFGLYRGRSVAGR